MTKLSTDSADNIALVIQLAKNYFSPVLASLVAAQAILESGLSNSPPSQLALEDCNLFGQKPGHLVPTGTLGTVTYNTQEYLNVQGEMRTVSLPAQFLRNADIEDSFQQRKLLFTLDRYQDLQDAETFEEAAQEIYADGYATDPKYPQNLIAVYNEYIKEGSA